jgi:ABC-type dipeptide/oligopeptide/nickel transport system ATPase subunit
MVVRLGFAVATALRPEILITDEVFAVGDESFQNKCVAWALSLLRGKYRVRVLAADPEGRLMDTLELPLFVAGETRELGLCRLPHEWQAIERVAGHLES